MAAKLDCEIAIADGVHRVSSQDGFAISIDKIEEFCGELAIERQCRTGNSAAAERADVDSRQGVFEALAIAIEHFDIGEEMVSEINGLCALQMGVARNNDIHFAAG